MLHHTLITRFNLATPDREASFRNLPGWLEARFDLFRRYCLPSIAAQSCQDFDWLVFFDENTPDWARSEILRLHPVRPFHAIFTPIFDNGGWARAVRAIAGPPRAGRRLLTSNLDNDDALAIDYIERVRRKALETSVRGRFAINVPDGLIFSENRIYLHRHRQNAFTNLVEPDDGDFSTTMTIRHMELADHVPVIQAEGKPGWLQVIHDTNVSNRVRGRRVSTDRTHARFPAGIPGDISDPSRVVQLAEYLLVWPLRELRDRIFALYRRIVRVDPDADES